MRQERRVRDDSLQRLLESPLPPTALEELVNRYDPERLLPLVLAWRRSPRPVSKCCLIYSAVFLLCCLLSVFIPSLWAFAALMVLCSPVIVIVAYVDTWDKGHLRTTNFQRVLLRTVQELRDSNQTRQVVTALRYLRQRDNPTLWREVRHELTRLMLRMPTERARELTGWERLCLRVWLWGAMKRDLTEDAEFCMAALLVLGDARDHSAWLPAWLCARGHREIRVREAACACLDELKRYR